MTKRKPPKAKLTALIVGEGSHDKAFLNHMKSIYDGRETGQKVTVDSADGGSPSDIIKSTIRKRHHADFDRRYILMDSDVGISHKDRKRAKSAGIELIISTPVCLEGMLLEIIGEAAFGTNQACKDALHPLLSGRPTMAKSYTEKFTKPILDGSAKSQIITLRNAIGNMKAK
ncbi:MAG: hypothetical protein COB71_02360 [Thiotrichales bacterium]|nr:MAG: hypothetical protein COB71_02360 [Thiotrichales bacterium]